MKDYIGGHTVPVQRDRKGRVTHQAERNVYLPQPNWLILNGGSVIDVAKLESIHYEDDEHKILWRTVHSSNDSATHDDGSVRFARVPSGTEITVVARQQFRLPPFWQMVNLDRFPEIKNRFVATEYFKFFDETIDNFERAYSGDEIRIGRTWDPTHGEDVYEQDEVDLMTRRASSWAASAAKTRTESWTRTASAISKRRSGRNTTTRRRDGWRDGFPPAGATRPEYLVVGFGPSGRQGRRRGGTRGVKALVTGSNGLIGSNIVRVLLRQGHQVRGLVRATSDLRSLRGLDLERVQGDVLDRGSLEAAMEGCDVVFHTAGIFTYWGRDEQADRDSGPGRDAERAEGGGLRRRRPGRPDLLIGHLRLVASAGAA